MCELTPGCDPYATADARARSLVWQALVVAYLAKQAEEAESTLDARVRALPGIIHESVRKLEDENREALSRIKELEAKLVNK